MKARHLHGAELLTTLMSPLQEVFDSLSGDRCEPYLHHEEFSANDGKPSISSPSKPGEGKSFDGLDTKPFLDALTTAGSATIK